MKERDLFLCMVTLAAAVLAFIMGADGASVWLPDFRVAFILATVVFVCAALLARTVGAPRPVAGALQALACVTVFLYCPNTASLIIYVAALSVASDYLKPARANGVGCIACLLAVVVVANEAPEYRNDVITITLAYVLGLMAFYVLHLMEKRAEARRDADGLSAGVQSLRERIGSQSRLAKSREQISKLEERNRLAARIHDEIGHGMSGSILLLEGADMIMDKDPGKARETVRRVTENLRESTEKIRAVLHEERDIPSEVNLARIRGELAAFGTDHPRISTEFKAEGNPDAVPAEVWICILDNMLEAMTNTLKHSNATAFRVSIRSSNKLLTAELADNGTGAGVSTGAGGSAAAGGSTGAGASAETEILHKGMGLQNMEERCALAYGRCFFRSEPDGFRVVMTFPLRS